MRKNHTVFEFMVDTHETACMIPLMLNGTQVYLIRTQSGAEHFFIALELHANDTILKRLATSQVLEEYGVDTPVLYV